MPEDRFPTQEIWFLQWCAELDRLAKRNQDGQKFLNCAIHQWRSGPGWSTCLPVTLHRSTQICKVQEEISPCNRYTPDVTKDANVIFSDIPQPGLIAENACKCCSSGLL